MKKLLNKNTIAAIAILLIAAAAFGVGYLFAPKQQVEKLVIAENDLVVTAKNSEINVSEADSSATRTSAYINNLTIKYNGKTIDISNGNMAGDSYVSNGVVVSFSIDENGRVVATAQYGNLSSQTSFLANVHSLINDANGNTIYGSDSYGFMFDVDGNKINNGHISSHEQDMDENGNVVGVQDETKVVMKETQKVSSLPSTGSIETVEKKQDYSPVVNNSATGADMSNVETTVETVVANPTAAYKQITIANINGNGDGTTLNAVSTNGGSGTLVLYCVSVEGNTYHCVSSTGSNVDIIMSNVNGNITFSGINGVYQ